MKDRDFFDSETDTDELVELASRAVSRFPRQCHGYPDLQSISENAVFKVVGRDNNAYALRIHRRGYHSRTEVESELAWIRSLGATDDVRVPSVIPATDGSAVVEVGGRLAVFFTWIEGESPSTVWDIAAIAFELGQLASRLHRHSKTWVRPWWFKRFAWDLEAAYGQHPRWGSWKLHPDLDEEAVKVLGPLQATVERNLSQSGVKPLLIHADLRATNLVVGDNGLLHVIDFDDCGFAWPMYDLATAFSFEEDNEAVPELIKIWLDGYGAEPSRELLSHVWTLIAYRRLLLLGWLATHPMADANLDFGASFAFRTVAFADRVMSHINLRGSPG